MSTQYPPLPYRRLKMMANGIWDEVNKAFYPFKVRTGTVNAMSGVRRFVHTFHGSIRVDGITAATQAYFTITVDGSAVNIGYIKSPALTQATDYWAMVTDGIVDVLTDANTPITVTAFAGANITYADIPDDLGWVMVE